MTKEQQQQQQQPQPLAQTAEPPRIRDIPCDGNLYSRIDEDWLTDAPVISYRVH